MKFPCRQCLKRAICQSQKRIECTDLFFIIIENADFDRGNKIVNKNIKIELKQILHVVEHILPGKDWKKERLDDNSLRDLHNISSLQDEDPD